MIIKSTISATNSNDVHRCPGMSQRSIRHLPTSSRGPMLVSKSKTQKRRTSNNRSTCACHTCNCALPSRNCATLRPRQKGLTTTAKNLASSPPTLSHLQTGSTGAQNGSGNRKSESPFLCRCCCCCCCFHKQLHIGQDSFVRGAFFSA